MLTIRRYQLQALASCIVHCDRGDRTTRNTNATSRGGSRKIVWGGQKFIFAPPNFPFPYTYHVKSGQFGGGKNIFLPRIMNFLPRLPPPGSASGDKSGGARELLLQGDSLQTMRHLSPGRHHGPFTARPVTPRRPVNPEACHTPLAFIRQHRPHPSTPVIGYSHLLLTVMMIMLV